MYVPASFAQSEPAKLHAFMRQHSFAVLTSSGASGLIASHLPLLLDPEDGVNGSLLGHMARANPQWRQAEGEVMVVFAGPHAYVSPSWYEEAGTVPTWNYVAVHAYGTFHVIEDQDTLRNILHRSVGFFENPRPKPWSFDETGPNVAGLLKSIVGFRVELTRIEGKWKLSQNHPEGRRRKVMDALALQADENSQQVAGMMADLEANRLAAGENHRP